MEVPGKIMRGKPKRRWLDNIKNDLSERELSGGSARPSSYETSTTLRSPKGCGRRREEEDYSVPEDIIDHNGDSSLS